MNPTSTNTPTPNPSVQLSPFENHMLISTREDDAAWAQVRVLIDNVPPSNLTDSGKVHALSGPRNGGAG